MTKSFIFSWILMWSISYIICGVVSPEIFSGVPRSFAMLFLLGYGLSMLFGLLLNLKPLLFAIGIGEVIAGIASWVGLFVWSVPWLQGYDPLAQISMAVLDLLSAVFLFTYSFDFITTYFVRAKNG